MLAVVVGALLRRRDCQTALEKMELWRERKEALPEHVKVGKRGRVTTVKVSRFLRVKYDTIQARLQHVRLVMSTYTPTHPAPPSSSLSCIDPLAIII